MKNAVLLLLRIGLAGLFLVAGAAKLRNPVAFAGEIVNYRWMSSLAGYAAASLPMVELVLGAALLLAPAPWRRAAALAMLGLLTLFTVAVTQVVARHINIDCGCFGVSSGPVNDWTVLRDVAMLLAAGALVWLTPATSPSGRRRESPA
jgi:uncharacterized membrane protein YphA (DoxX/SURF4 family)